MSRFSKKNLLASLALMTFTSQLVAATLALPAAPAAARYFPKVNVMRCPARSPT